jgi:L,D-transpeptidase ErfK/SrfK
MAVMALALGAALTNAVAVELELPSKGAVVGVEKEIIASSQDTLLDIAKAHNLGYEALKLANPGVDPWLPGAGKRVRLPTRFVLPAAPRRGVVLNLAEMRIYYYPKVRKGEPATVHTYPVSIGRYDWETPLGRTRIVSKVRDPAWYPPKSIRAEHAAAGSPLPAVVPPGPDNPLGNRALQLGRRGYLIHGTNKPYGIGMRVSHGCIRMYPEDIVALFDAVPVGTRVQIVNQPIKVGWNEAGHLYVEAHPREGESEARAREGVRIDVLRAEVLALAGKVEEGTVKQVDWNAVKRVATDRSGVPVAVLKPAAPVSLAGLSLRLDTVLPARPDAPDPSAADGAKPPSRDAGRLQLRLTY